MGHGNKRLSQSVSGRFDIFYMFSLGEGGEEHEAEQGRGLSVLI